MKRNAAGSTSPLRSALAVAALAAIGSIGLTAHAQTSPAITLQATSVFPEADFSSDVFRRWADIVRQKTNGRIALRHHFAGSLVGAKTLDGLRDGVVDVALQFTSYVSGDIVDLGVFDIPFAFPVEAKATAAFHRAVKPSVAAIYAKHGSRVVAATPVILATPISCKDRFLNTPEKWKGTLIRVGGRWGSESVKAWGGSPVVLGPGELYSGLDRGTINCTLMVYNGLNSMKLYEVAPRVTRLDFSIAFGTINISERTWAKLSEADRKAMMDAGDEIVDWAAEETNRRLASQLQDLEKRGAKFCVPDEKEFARLVGAVDKVIDQLRPLVSPEGAAILKVVDQYRTQAKARPVPGPVATSCS